jgi:uncharacterized membrane protein YbaN (DUF454 family)
LKTAFLLLAVCCFQKNSAFFQLKEAARRFYNYNRRELNNQYPHRRFGKVMLFDEEVFGSL